jgi:hypothetical protein
MPVSESGSPRLHQPDPSLNDDQPWGSGDHPRADNALFWIWMTPVYLGIAGLVLYVLYALGFIG